MCEVVSSSKSPTFHLFPQYVAKYVWLTVSKSHFHHNPVETTKNLSDQLNSVHCQHTQYAMRPNNFNLWYWNALKPRGRKIYNNFNHFQEYFKHFMLFRNISRKFYTVKLSFRQNVKFSNLGFGRKIRLSRVETWGPPPKRPPLLTWKALKKRKFQNSGFFRVFF